MVYGHAEWLPRYVASNTCRPIVRVQEASLAEQESPLLLLYFASVFLTASCLFFPSECYVVTCDGTLCIVWCGGFEHRSTEVCLIAEPRRYGCYPHEKFQTWEAAARRQIY